MGWKFDEHAAVRRAYIDLLELPHGAIRARLQSVLATLRDEIAAGGTEDAESVQNSYERFVRDFPSEYAAPPKPRLECQCGLTDAGRCPVCLDVAR